MDLNSFSSRDSRQRRGREGRGGAEERDMAVSDSTTVPVSRPSKRSRTRKTSRLYVVPSIWFCYCSSSASSRSEVEISPALTATSGVACAHFSNDFDKDF